MFEDAVKHRGLHNYKVTIKYLHHMGNNKLVGLSGNARDLKDFIENTFSKVSCIADVTYYVYVDNRFRDMFNNYLENNGSKALSISTITRIVNELKERNVLLYISKGKYLYNFVDFCHIGNKEQYEFDKVKYDIIPILNKLTNK